MDEIRVHLKGHNDPSNMIDLRGIGESLMYIPLVVVYEASPVACYILVQSPMDQWLEVFDLCDIV